MILMYLVLSGIVISICIAWTYFLCYIIISLKRTPSLRQFAIGRDPYTGNFETVDSGLPKISIIIPARNEEKYIEECLDGLLRQTYQNFEIIVVDDGSSDRTAQLLQRYGMKDARIKIVTINVEKNWSDGWTGKTWACYQGYIHSTGNILLFTDADTTHSHCTLSLSFQYFLSNKLNALTLIPRLRAEDFWTRLILPVLWTLSYARYSPQKANDPGTRNGGYFFGSFFMISRDTYEAIGTHERVRAEIVEDVELGRMVKERGHRSQVVRGEHHVTAVWARNLGTLWDGLRRLMIPLYLNEKANAILITIGTSLMLLVPPTFSIILIMLNPAYPLSTNLNDENGFPWYLVLLVFSIITTILILVTSVIQSKSVIFQNLIYTLGFPIAGTILSAAFLSAIFDSRKINSIRWHERDYSYSPPN